MTRVSRRRGILRRPTRLLAMAGLGAVIAALFASAATSGQAIQFSVTVSPSPPTAGSAFTATVTALDANGNADNSYKDNHNLTFSGAANSPNGDAPSYPPNPVVFDKGVASVQVTLFNAASTTLHVTDGTITGDSAAFTVNHGTPASLSFTGGQPPTWVAKNTNFSASATVKDAWGNLATSEAVSVTLNQFPQALTCTPSCTVQTDSTTGVAAFTLSVSKDSVGYQLVATSVQGSATGTSAAFKVADQISNCQGNGNCANSGSDDAGTTTNSSIASFTGQAALAVDGSLNAGVPVNLCGTGAPLVGSATFFEVVSTTSGTPNWTISMSVAKSALIDPNRGAAQYDVCLGTVNLTQPAYNGTDPVTCAPNTPSGLSTSVSWLRKGGDCAQYDANTKMFWGNVPDAGSKVKNCSQALSPAVLSKNKTGSGTLVITFCVPFPWDGWGGSH
jgi:hypothetical protein